MIKKNLVIKDKWNIIEVSLWVELSKDLERQEACWGILFNDEYIWNIFYWFNPETKILDIWNILIFDEFQRKWIWTKVIKEIIKDTKPKALDWLIVDEDDWTALKFWKNIEKYCEENGIDFIMKE